MNGFIVKALGTACFAGGLLLSVGCGPHYNNLVDPCYPERYNAMARREVRDAMTPQIQNGHVLDQTVWNHHFDHGTGRLNDAGQAHLQYLIRRRPAPDTNIYVQAAGDVAYDPEAPSKLVETRNNLDGERVASVQKYLAAASAGRNLTFNVMAHDPATAGMPSTAINQGVRLRVLGGPSGSIPSAGPVTAPTVSGNTGSFR